MQLFGAPGIKPSFEAQMATKRVASAPEPENLGVAGKLGGDVRLSSGARGMRLQVGLPMSFPNESTA
jgi:hypothetical protein